MNSYVQSDLILHIEKYFVKEQFIRLIKISMNLNIFSLILSYIMSLNEKNFEKFWNNLFEIMCINHRIFILICKYFSNKIMDRNIWVEKLNQLISGYDSSFKNTLQIMKEISIFCNYLINLIPKILTLYANLELISIYNSLEIISSIELISIYREKFHQNLNQNGSIFASSSYFKKNKIFEEKPQSPFLQKKSNNKKYTLVLDLDETLIHFKPNPNNESSGKIMIRPFLYDFLRSIKKYYELIIFTAATEDYANPIINAIEKDEKFFDYRLYRVHTTIVDNDFVKDLSKLGRDLNRTIIVDNMKQNYKNQPDNGITIRPFWGKDVEDTALVDLLDILKKIAENDMNVISGLKFFKEDIISKVSSNILRRAQNK
jgi:Dullard-like phosphatase family protein